MSLLFTDEEIQAQAVRLGLIQEGGELPRHMRSRVVATLVQERAPQQSKTAEPQLAKEIVVQPGGVILVDGESFPWLVAKEPMDIRLDPEGFSTVRLTLLADAVQIIKSEPREDHQ